MGTRWVTAGWRVRSQRVVQRRQQGDLISRWERVSARRRRPLTASSSTRTCWPQPTSVMSVPCDGCVAARDR